MATSERPGPPPERDPWADVLAHATRDGEEDDYVLESPISEARKQSFRQHYLRDREETGTVEALFDRSGRLRIEPQWTPLFAFGFSVLLEKGPFVEGSNWLPYKTWHFAVAAERHILGLFERSLRRHSRVELPGIDPTPRSWPAILGRVGQLIRDIEPSPRENRLIVLTGTVEPEFMTQLRLHATPDGDLPDPLRRLWIMGAYHDAPMLHIRRADSPAVYVVDLSRFATLKKFGTEPQFNIEGIDVEHARELLHRNPALVADPPPESEQEEERVRRLRLKVGLTLFESYSLDRSLNREDLAASSGWPLAPNPGAEGA